MKLSSIIHFVKFIPRVWSIFRQNYFMLFHRPIVCIIFHICKDTIFIKLHIWSVSAYNIPMNINLTLILFLIASAFR